MSLTALVGIGIMLAALFVAIKTHRAGPTFGVLVTGVIVFMAGSPQLLQSLADVGGSLLVKAVQAVERAVSGG